MIGINHFNRHVSLPISLLFILTLTACGGGSGAGTTESADTSESVESDIDLDANNPLENNSESDNDNESESEQNESEQNEVDEPNPSAGNSFYGILTISPFGDGAQAGASAQGNFFRFSGNLDSLQSDISATLTEDDCSVFGVDEIGQSAELLTAIDAGEVIVLGNASGTVGEMTMLENLPLVYVADIQQLGPDLLTTFDVPGAEFPAFNNGTVPDSARIDVTSPSPSEQITEDTEFSWTPTPFSDDTISITSSSVTPEGILSGYTCEVLDDGQFTLPTSVQDTLGSDFVSTSTAVLSMRSFVERRGNVLMGVFVLNRALLF